MKPNLVKMKTLLTQYMIELLHITGTHMNTVVASYLEDKLFYGKPIITSTRCS